MSDLPTPQAIHDARAYMVEGYRRSVGPLATPEEFREAGDGLAQLLGVFAFAEECRAAQVEGEAVPEVETPEDAGDDGWIAWEGGECPVPRDTVVECEARDGERFPPAPAFTFYWDDIGEGHDIVRYRLAQPSQPTTDPEARVRAMSDEEVEAALTGRGVGAWILAVPSENLHDRDWLDPSPFVAITLDGALVNSAGQFLDRDLGDTTTPEGRAECSRRLLVHLLREEGANG